MQNQNLTQSYINLKQPSNTSQFKFNKPNNLKNSEPAASSTSRVSLSEKKSSKDEKPPNGNTCLRKYDQVIRDILGYPVIQVISDEQGDVILDIGDLITYQAVERAIKANVLKNLLEAVYIKK